MGLITLGTMRHDRGVGVEKRHFEVSRLVLGAGGLGRRACQVALLVLYASLVDRNERVRKQLPYPNGITFDSRSTPLHIQRNQIGGRVRAGRPTEQSENSGRQHDE